MLVAAAVCPHPPLLIPAALGAAGLDAAGVPGADAAVPGVDAGGPGGAAAEPGAAVAEPGAVLRQVRAACFAAVADLLRAGPDLIVVVGTAARSAAYGGSAAGSLADYGIPFVTGTGDPVLPLSLTVGAWLVRRAAQPGQALKLHAVARDTPAAECQRLGEALARAAARVSVLAMGDGSARRAAGVPGAPDPAADRYDQEVAAALAAADPARLARLDPALDDELVVAGRAAWQVLAGAAAQSQLRGTLRCAAAPYDVSYLVASWQCAPTRPGSLSR